MTNRALAYRATVAIMGVSGLVAQMVLLREFLIISAGNEMTIGIILANWLVIEAAGAALAGRVRERRARQRAVYVLLTVLFCLSLPPAVYGVRVLKATLGLSVGETPGLAILFGGSFLLLLPTSLTHGALFPLACGVASRLDARGDSVLGRAYLLETAGTLVGGVAWTWLLVPHVHSFGIVMGVVAVNAAGCLALLGRRDGWPSEERRFAAIAFVLSGVVLVASVGSLLTGAADGLHRASISRQWRGQNVVDYENSVHGNITVVANQGQYSFFTDGTLSLITPIPDSAYVQTYAHVPLTVHPDPRRVLLIGGGPGGLIRELLKHPNLDEIRYAEVDPMVIDLIRRHSTALTEAELDSPRVSVELIDGRSHLLRSSKQYDVILSALSNPSDLQTNRFFTTEFYELASSRLTADGIVVVRLPAALGFQNQELTELLASLYASLASVFPHVRVFPDEGGTMAIASPHPGIEDYDVGLLVSRLSERGVSAETALPWDIERRLHPGWQDWFLDLVAGGSRTANLDYKPFGVFVSLSYWNSLHAPALNPLFRVMRSTRPWIPSAVLFLVFAPLVAVAVRRNRGPIVGPAVFGTGAAGMLFSLSLIFAFQSLFGHLFAWIGLLTAVFMAGSAAGALAVTRSFPRLDNARRAMVYSEAAVLAAAVLLPAAVRGFSPILEGTAAFGLLRGFFLTLPFLCGVLTGAQFPLAGKLQEGESPRASGAAGTLYAADLLGGWLGGLLGGVFLLPVLGLTATALTVGFLKLLTLLLYLSSLPRRARA